MGALGNLLCHSGMARKKKEKLQDAMGAADQKTVKRIAEMQRTKKTLQRIRNGIAALTSPKHRFKAPGERNAEVEAAENTKASSPSSLPRSFSWTSDDEEQEEEQKTMKDIVKQKAARQIRKLRAAMSFVKHLVEDMEERMKAKEAEKRSRKEKTKRESGLSPSSSTSSLASSITTSSSSSSSSASSSELENEEEEEEDGGNGDPKKGTHGEGEEDREANLKNGFGSTKIQGIVQEGGQQQQQQQSEEVNLCKHLKKKYKKKKKRGIDSPTQCDFCAAIYADHHEFF